MRDLMRGPRFMRDLMPGPGFMRDLVHFFLRTFVRVGLKHVWGSSGMPATAATTAHGLVNRHGSKVPCTAASYGVLTALCPRPHHAPP